MNTFQKLLFPVAALAVASAGFAAGHEHHAPHRGTLVVLGAEFAHLELVLDAGGALTGYVLDGEAEKAARIKQPEIVLTLTTINGQASAAKLTLKAVANVLTGETVGDTSQFSASAAELKGARKFEGQIEEIAARGQTFKNVKFRYPEGNE